MRLRTDTLATGIDVAGRRLTVWTPDGREESLSYDALVIGTGAVSVQPRIDGRTGDDALGPRDGEPDAAPT